MSISISFVALQSLQFVLLMCLAASTTLAFPAPDVSSEFTDQDVAKLAAMQAAYEQDNGEADVQKRAALSINNDLVSLAQMMQGGASRREFENAQNLLASIGKRSPPAPYRRRSRAQLSVGIPLDAISDMMEEQRRRLMQEGMRSQMMKIGKRALLQQHQESVRQSES